jgi:hypothetical protein
MTAIGESCRRRGHHLAAAIDPKRPASVRVPGCRARDYNCSLSNSRFAHSPLDYLAGAAAQFVLVRSSLSPLRNLDCRHAEPECPSP